MSERIRGLSIELDLDTIRVESGMTDLRSKMRLLNSEMRNNLSAFDRGERSVGRYQTRIDGLNKKITLQTAIVDKARDRYEEMVKQYGEGSAQAEKAAADYNRQSAELNSLERQVSRVSDELRELQKEQAIADSGWTKAGSNLTSFGNNLSLISEKVKDTGKNLSKYITAPALGVATALGGITAKLGWDRLVGLDSAQAQLEGLGYTTEEVARISDQVVDAIQGGMTTMAEGTSVAAGALAAGVEEGEELERYIKLVGDAAVGANRPVDNMAQIFNRVQGSGRLMTQELNMIEQGMPGFAQAMADSLGVSQEEFRNMVTNGEIDSNRFMDVMDDFAGNMASAYADSWRGMVANTKAYIGIIGENLLGGVFEQSKESIAEFIDFLSSDEVVTWAEEMGQTIGRVFSNVVESVKDGITWFSELESSKQGLILKSGALVVALGPLLVALGTLGGAVAGLAKGLGVISTFVGKAKVLTAFGASAGAGAKKVGLLTKATALLAGPAAIVVGAVAAMAGWFTAAYRRSEPFREGISQMGDAFRLVYDEMRTFLTTNPQMIAFFDILRQGFNWVKNDLNKTWTGLVRVFDFLADGIGIAIQKANAYFMDGFLLVVPFLTSLAESIESLFRGDFREAFSTLGEGFSELWSGFRNLLDDYFGDMVRDSLEWLRKWGISIADWFRALPGRIAESVSGAVSAASDWVSDAWDKSMSKLGDYGRATIEWFKGIPSSISSAVSDWATASGEWASDAWDTSKENLAKWLSDMAGWFADRGRDFSEWLGEWKDTIVEWFRGLPSAISNQLSEWGDAFNNFLEEQHEENKRQYGEWGKAILDWIKEMPSSIKSGFSEWKDTIVTWFSDTQEDIRSGMLKWGIQVTLWFSESIDNVKEGFSNWKDTITTWFSDSVRDFQDGFSEWTDTTAAWFKDSVESVKDGFAEWRTAVVTWFTNTKDDFTTGLSNLWGSVTDWFVDTRTKWNENLGTWRDSIVTFFVELPGNIKESVTDFFAGIQDMILGWRDNFVDSFNSWKDGLMDWFRGLGQEEEIKETGKQIVKNIASGSEEEEKTLMDSLGSILLNAILYALAAIGIMALALGREIIIRVIDGMKSLWSWLTGVFDDLVTMGREKLTEFANNTAERMESMRQNATERAREMRDGVVNWFVSLRDGAVERVTNMREQAVSRFTTMKENFLDIGRDIRDGVRERFDDLVESARALPGRIGNGIRNMAGSVKEGVKSFANTIGETLETGVNKVIGGMNSLLSTIGVSLRVPEINVPAYAVGTKDHPGGPAVVGEKGRELAHIPGEGYTMLGKQGAELLNLPKGSSVLPNKETENILKDGMGLPGYESGIGRAFNWVRGKAQEGWENIRGLASDAVGWLMDAPRRIFEKAMEFTGVSMPEADSFAGGVMRGSFTALRDGAADYLTKAQEEVTPSSPSFGSMFRMTSPFGWRTHPITGERRHHDGVDYAAPMGTPLLSQSAGAVTYSGWMGGYGNTVRVKSGIFDHYYAHNMRNLVSNGQAVRPGQMLALVGSTGMSTGPHVHYEVRKNGTPVNPRGFETGGWIRDKMLALLGDGGYPEWVIPTDPARASEAMKLLALAGKDIESRGGAKRPNQLPNPGYGGQEESKDNKYLEQIIDKLSEQVEDTKEIVTLLAKILMKDNGITLKELSQHIDRYNVDVRRRGGGSY